MSLTSSQSRAIAARGNVLVVAGAGTGKTSTLVERCLNCLLTEQPPVSLDEILMVTFTDAAAAEMRQRIRGRLEEERQEHPEDPRWQEELALFETAHIGTLHHFCLELVRQHFYQLELDPQLAVLAQEEAQLLANETLEDLLQEHYAGRGKTAEAVQQLIQSQGRGSDKPIRGLVLRLHNYAQTLPDPAGWIEDQLALFASNKPAVWQDWLKEAVDEWRQRWLPLLKASAIENELAAQSARVLEEMGPSRQNQISSKARRKRERKEEGAPQLFLPGLEASPRAQTATHLQSLSTIALNCPWGKKTVWLKPLEAFLNEADFLFSLVSCDGQAAGTSNSRLQGNGHAPSAAGQPSLDPLAEDWDWVRPQMTTLLELAKEFTEAFAQAKRELGVVDFHDLEQFALKLLWDPRANQPTDTAQHWRKKLRFVFVDEYQDINAAQDKLIEALSRDRAQANRFLVGDIKQSIYRFRLANPHIFQGYVETWRNGAGEAIPLVENFRSREGILDFINSMFVVLMRRELGGVEYDETAKLRFGAPDERGDLGWAANPAPCVELHLRTKGNGSSQDQDSETSEALAHITELEDAAKEARLVALRLRELKTQGLSVWDETAKAFRPVDWSDMAILLRSPANKADSYAKEFARLNVPLLVARTGFYESLEISDLLSLLQLLDNPLQDLPVLAVLRSPLVGLTLDELADVRLAALRGHFWTALVEWNDIRRTASDSDQGHGATPGETPEALAGGDACATPGAERDAIQKVANFLERFGRWRRMARQVCLSRCLETVLAETHYAEWLRMQPRGEQRYANVQRLVALAQQFDAFQRQGLFRFLRFIEAQQLAETEPEVAAVSEENSVRLMSIHQSKGLEFPVVIVADLGKPFNESDLRADIILDEKFGLCPQIKPPHTGNSYPSLPYWMARRRQHREMLGEELRLLYVAMTRARDRLILTGTVVGARFDKLRNKNGDVDIEVLLSARCYSDWLALWFSSRPQRTSFGGEGIIGSLQWAFHDDKDLMDTGGDVTLPESVAELLSAKPDELQKLEQRLAWRYPFTAATRQPAKMSVSALRHSALEADELAERRPPGLRVSTINHRADLEVRAPFPQASVPNGIGSKLRVTPSALRAPLSSAADIGTIHHTFLQLVSLEKVNSRTELKQEARRMQQENALSAEEAALLDFEGLAAFWASDLGGKVRAQAQFVQRELPFTARFSAGEILAITGKPPESNLAEEFVVVQGVADLAVVRPEEIWLIDFKSDRVGKNELTDKIRAYAPQLSLYAQAMTRIYRRPVSECWLYFLDRREAVRVEV